MEVLVLAIAALASIWLGLVLAKAALIGIFSITDVARVKHRAAGRVADFVNA